MILFVDDEKMPEWFRLPEDTLHAKTLMKATDFYIDNEEIDTIYLDHDLGGKTDGSQWLKDMCNIRPPKQVFNISFNPVGRERIRWVCKDFNIPFKDMSTMFDGETIEGQSG